MKFIDWLFKFKDVDLPIGDLARDVAGDKGFPSSQDYEKIEDYLIHKRACDEALKTLKAAWMFYKAGTN